MRYMVVPLFFTRPPILAVFPVGVPRNPPKKEVPPKNDTHLCTLYTSERNFSPIRGCLNLRKNISAAVRDL